ncbi:MAG: hypothetical protein DMF58_20250 [Acidobacteria bacterium]|nr:MAG: hypothetical protein DMF58_20250 [Acidobacteriota bacterium]
MEAGHDERDVVLELLGRREAADVVVDRVVRRVQLAVARFLEKGGDAIDRIELARVAAAVGEAVGVNEERVAGIDPQRPLVVRHPRHRTEEGARVFEENGFAALAQQKSWMCRVGVAKIPVTVDAKELRRRVLRRKADAEKKIVEAGHEVGKPSVRIRFRVDVALQQ